MSSRRGKGEGSICQRASDSLWVGTVDLGRGPDGKRKRKTLYGKTRKEVAERMKIVLRDQQQGLPIPTGRKTVGQFLEHWLTDVVKHTRKATTYVTYRGQIKNHLAPSLGHHQLAKLEPQHIQEFMSHKLASGLDPKTVRYSYMVLRGALEQALKWNLVGRNICELVDPPSAAKYEAHSMTPEQARTFLHAVHGHRLEALWTVAIAIGLRRAEALGLRWQDLDLDSAEPSLTVRGGLYRIDGKLQILSPKTSTSTRNIMLPTLITTALRTHRVRQLEERLLAGPRWREHGLVFSTGIGTPLEPRNVTRLFKSTLEKAGMPQMRLHDARHTAATLMLVQGIPVKVVSEILGHARSSITQDIYQHVLRSQQQDAANKMDALLTIAT